MIQNNRLFLILSLCLAASVSSAIASVLHISFFFPIAVTIGIIATVLLFEQPLLFLSSLFFIRMITDYASQNISVSLFEFSFSISQVIGIGIALLGMPFLFKYRSRITAYQLLIPFALLFTWGLASTLFSINIARTLQDLVRIFDIFIIGFIAFVSIQKPKDFRLFLTVILVSSIAPILAGFIQFILGIGLQDDSVSVARIFGTFAHPNVYSLYLFSVVVCSSLFILTTPTNTQRNNNIIFGGLILATSFLALILTFARVSWVIAFLFFIALSLWKHPKLLIPIIFVPLIIFAASPILQDRILQTFTQTSDSSTSWRIMIWQDVTQRTISEHHQWHGYGLETFPVVAEQLRGDQFGSNEAHNDYVKFFTEGGFIGLGVFLTYLFLIFRTMMRGYKNTISNNNKLIFGILMIFFASMMTASLSDNIFKNTPLWWVIMSLTGGALGLVHYENTQQKPKNIPFSIEE